MAKEWKMFMRMDKGRQFEVFPFDPLRKDKRERFFGHTTG